MARVCVDSNYFDVDDEGRLTVVKGSLGYQETIQVFGGLAPGTFEIANYPLATWLFVECIGGGGGGCGADATASGTTGAVGGGGAGGTYAASWIRTATLPAVVVMSAGAGGAAGIYGSGGNGVQSNFGTLVVAPGGNGANEIYGPSTTNTRNPGGTPGALGTGQIRRLGQPGDNAVMTNSFTKTGGNGGASGWPGAGGIGGLASAPGSAGQTFAGGGGGGAAAFGAAYGGGIGGSGIVRVHIYN